MRRLVGAVILLALSMASCRQGQNKAVEKKDSVAVVVPVTTEDRNELSEVITRFVRAYISKDNKKANALIHPDLGFTVIYRPGVADTFLKIDTIDFAKPIPENYAYPEIGNDYVLVYEKLPEFDCGTEKWDKLGLVCDTTSHPNQLSNIIAFEKEFDEKAFSEEMLDSIEVNELASFRVILTTATPLVFHVQKYRGRWYVTTLDRAYAGCDA